MKYFFDTKVQLYILMIAIGVIVFSPYIPMAIKIASIIVLFIYKFILLEVKIYSKSLLLWIYLVWKYYLHHKIYVKTNL